MGCWSQASALEGEGSYCFSIIQPGIQLRVVASKQLMTEAIGPWFSQFSSWLLRVLMRTINNKSKRNDRGKCLGWPVTTILVSNVGKNSPLPPFQCWGKNSWALIALVSPTLNGGWGGNFQDNTSKVVATALQPVGAANFATRGLIYM